MHYKTGRQNHNFQIVHFLIGSCSTADAAYALLQDQYEDRNNALKMFVGAKKREEAKVLTANETIDLIKTKMNGEFSSDITVRDQVALLQAEAELADIEALRETTERNYMACEAERDFIKECMDKLEPLRKYAHLPLAEAHQAAQRDEWRGELMRRAENFLITAGSIPHDQFQTMRMHPDFQTIIYPHTNNVQMLLRTGQYDQAMQYCLENKSQSIDVMQVLGIAYDEREAVALLPAPGPKTVTHTHAAAPDFRPRHG